MPILMKSNPEIVHNIELFHIKLYKTPKFFKGRNYSTKKIAKVYCKCSLEKQATEEIFENYRKEYAPQLPSRSKCLFVCKKEFVERWIKELIRDHRYDYEVLKIKCNGIVFWADSFLFSEADLFSPQGYWKGCDANNQELFPEGLFQGNYVVIQNCTSQFKKPT